MLDSNTLSPEQNPGLPCLILRAYKDSVTFHSGQRNTSDKESLELEMLQVLDNLYANQSIAYKKARGKVKGEP